jgi:hypothetical protein
MHLVKDYQFPAAISVEQGRIVDHVPNGWEVAVEIQRSSFSQGFGDGGFAAAPDPGKPYDRGFAPAGFDALRPEWPWQHVFIISI